MAKHHLESHTPHDVIVLGRVSGSQDSVVVDRGGWHHATPQDTATARKSWSLSRINPHNTTYDGLCYTLNTRYEFAAISDYTHAKHCKTCVMYVVET